MNFFKRLRLFTLLRRFRGVLLIVMNFCDFCLILVRIISRVCCLVLAYLAYLSQFPALLIGRKEIASHLLSICSRQLLKALGIKVCIQSDFDWNRPGRGFVHIWNHENPLDVFIVQGYLRLPSITTAGSHLGYVLPFFDLTASSAGHILLDHMSPSSRRKSFHRAFETMSTYGQMIIAPNGSLVTSIYERVSRSPQVLARRFSTSIAPWVFVYRNLSFSRQDLYSPLSILLRRLLAPPATITCSLWERDLQEIMSDIPKELFEMCVMNFYISRKE